MDLLIEYLESVDVPITYDFDWGMFHRILCIFLWPLAFTIFLISFLKTYFGKND